MFWSGEVVPVATGNAVLIDGVVAVPLGRAVTKALEPMAQTPFNTIWPVDAETQDTEVRISAPVEPTYNRQPTAPVSAIGDVTV